jgi:hypothetical protein
MALLLAGCGGEAERRAETPAPTATPSATASATPTAGADCPAGLDRTPKGQLPDFIGVLSYSHLYRIEGRRVFYAWLEGTPADVRSRRDDVQNELVQSWGFASLQTAESGDAASARLEGNGHGVDVQVKPLCEGRLRIRYRLR